MKTVTISNMSVELVKPQFIISQLIIVLVAIAVVVVLVIKDYKLEARMVVVVDHL